MLQSLFCARVKLGNSSGSLATLSWLRSRGFLMGSRVVVEPGLVAVLLLDKVEQMDDGGRRHPGNTRRGAELKDTTGCVTGAISTRATHPP